MDATALLLSRLQFAFTVSFHIIYPSFTIGLRRGSLCSTPFILRPGARRIGLGSNSGSRSSA
jgi:hypothetical protein